jgi:hypothetical protein
LDWYDPRLFVEVLVVYLLSIADAAFTLVLVSAGIAAEVNPFMRVLLEHDPQVFANLKVALTGACLVFLTACSSGKPTARVRARRILRALLLFYVVLVGFQIGMLVRALI